MPKMGNLLIPHEANAAAHHAATVASDLSHQNLANRGVSDHHAKTVIGDLSPIAVADLVNTYFCETLMTARGDLLIRGASDPTRLAKGTNGQYLKIGANDPVWADVAVGATKEFFVPALKRGATPDKFGAYLIAPLITSGDSALMSFRVPGDFSSITNAEIIVIPRATQGTANWDITSNYAAAGESYNTHSETDTGTTYNVTNNQLFAVDISGILSSLAANDYVGITLTLSDNAHDVSVLQIRFKYS